MVGAWEASVLFVWHVRSFAVTENTILSCRWNFNSIFFLLGQRIWLVVMHFVVGDAFFFLSLFSLLSLKFALIMQVVFLFTEISTSVFILLIFNFCS
jgi:hypothetical protein